MRMSRASATAGSRSAHTGRTRPKQTARRCAPFFRPRPRSGNTPMASPTGPRCLRTGIRSTTSISHDLAPMKCSSTCSATTRATSRCIRNSRPIFASTSRRFWQLGARTIRSSCRLVRRHSNATYQTQMCASSTPATLHSRRTATRSPPRSASSSLADFAIRPPPAALSMAADQMESIMRAIVLEKFGGLDGLVYKDIPEPEPKAGHVVIQIKAFGINHAEMHMRRGEWAEAAPVSGIECVGLVKSCPGGEFPVGAKVAALMGGLGRTINGSYAEFTRAPVSNVALIEADLPWAELAAIPETYATAWTCLFRNLEIAKGQLLVIRGATSSFGQAALRMAANAGVRVIATSRDPERFMKLKKMGAERCEVERRDLSKHIPEAKKIDAVLDLVGNTVMLDSLAMLRRGGRSCLAGWLGGLDPIPDFNPLLQMASSVYLTFFGSFVFGTPGFPLSDVPLQQIAQDAAAGRLDVKPARVFRFGEIREAHRVMEANEARGKMVVVQD